MGKIVILYDNGHQIDLTVNSINILDEVDDCAIVNTVERGDIVVSKSDQPATWAQIKFLAEKDQNAV